MERRTFVKSTAVLGGGYLLSGTSAFGGQILPATEAPWFDKSMRFMQFAMVETDPGKFDPDFWLAYFKRIHADGILLNAGGGVAYYPTDIPLHHRSNSLGNSDPFGYMVEGCRKMNMTVIARTDPHAARQVVYDAHPDWIAVTADGQKRRHWANPELWVTCGLGPYNFEFMTEVHKEIMQRYKPEGIFSNRWAGSGMCYCEHCVENFKKFSGGMDLPRGGGGGRANPAAEKYREWNVARLRELWVLWDNEIRKIRPAARFLPNGFPDKLMTGEKSDFFFADTQTRSKTLPPWENGRSAKELRASLGMKPLIGIYSIGVIDEHRWVDSMQSSAEIRLWAAEGLAHGKRPCFVKFSGVMYDNRRWNDTIPGFYTDCFKNEKYLRNIAPIVRVGVVMSERTMSGAAWQQRSGDHATGMYQALVESRIPFDMVHEKLLDEEHLKRFKMLVLPSVAALSDLQCAQLKKFVENGGSIVATFETSLYDENGKMRSNFGLSDVFGVSYDKGVEGPMQNSYLKFKSNPATKKFHPVLNGLEDAFRIINFIYQVKVKPDVDFPSPVTLIPTYPDLPMEDVYPRIPDTNTRELYLREYGKGRVAYFPGDADRSFWEIMYTDHLKLIGNTLKWALNEEPVVDVKGPGIIDIAAWKQKKSMTVHLVNLTNPMMMKGTLRELIPSGTQHVSFKVPAGTKAGAVKLLISGKPANAKIENGKVSLTVSGILDHEIIGVDLV